MVGLPADLTASRLARAEVGTVADLLPDERADDAALCVAELVNNSVVHAADAPVLTLDVGPTELVVAVSDSRPVDDDLRRRLDSVRSGATEPAEKLPIGGRGLQIVHLLADAWGVKETAARPDHRGPDPLPGKTIWFSMDLGR